VEGSPLEGIALASDPDSFRIVMEDNLVRFQRHAVMSLELMRLDYCN